MVALSIIIPTFNRNESANACIRSILDCGPADLEIIVVNDYKEEAFILKENNHSAAIKIINNPKSGVAAARNYGAKHAVASRLLFVDDDMIVNKEALLKAIDFLNTKPHCTYNADWIYEESLLREISTIQFGRYLINYKFTSLKGWNNNVIEWKENTLLKSPGVTSQFFAISKADFDLIGGYNEKFPLAGFEDYDIRIKMIAHNITNYIDTTVMIYHNERDRIAPYEWLERKKRGAQTRKSGVNLGFPELKIEYPFIKKIIYKLLIPCKPAIMAMLSAIPNQAFFDGIYFRMINLLLGIHMFEGYTMKNDFVQKTQAAQT